MTSTTAVHAAIKAALEAAGVSAIDGPAKTLPTDGGLIAQTAVLWPAPRAHVYTRGSGDSSGGTDRVTILCIGATAFDALAVADAVEAAIGGMRISAKGGTLRQTGGAVDPAPEPNSDPVRVSLPVEYSVVTKG